MALKSRHLGSKVRWKLVQDNVRKSRWDYSGLKEGKLDTDMADAYEQENDKGITY